MAFCPKDMLDRYVTNRAPETMVTDDNVARVHDAIGADLVPARLFLLLWEKLGRTVSWTRLENELSPDHAEIVMRDSVSAALRRLRKNLAGHPVQIHTQRKIGLKLEAAPDWDWRADAPFSPDRLCLQCPMRAMREHVGRGG